MDFNEIITAWFTKFYHGPLQKELAEKRLKICATCPYKKEVIKRKEWTVICNLCGCSLWAKAFSRKEDACPNHYWREVEIDIFEKIKNQKKSLL